MDLVEKIARAMAAYEHKTGGYPAWDDLSSKEVEYYLGKARSVLSCIEEEGMVVVPREPEEARIDAMQAEVDDLGRHYHRILYRAAITFSPKKP
jgi:hypothetical protein